MNALIHENAKQIAKEAYIYAFPMLMDYRFAFASFLMPDLQDVNVTNFARA